MPVPMFWKPRKATRGLGFWGYLDSLEAGKLTPGQPWGKAGQAIGQGGRGLGQGSGAPKDQGEAKQVFRTQPTDRRGEVRFRTLG
jgi:hypothetical protein